MVLSLVSTRYRCCHLSAQTVQQACILVGQRQANLSFQDSEHRTPGLSVGDDGARHDTDIVPQRIDRRTNRFAPVDIRQTLHISRPLLRMRSEQHIANPPRARSTTLWVLIFSLRSSGADSIPLPTRCQSGIASATVIQSCVAFLTFSAKPADLK